jgi:hypothetical protein
MKRMLRAVLPCLVLGAASPLSAQQTDTPPALPPPAKGGGA